MADQEAAARIAAQIESTLAASLPNTIGTMLDAKLEKLAENMHKIISVAIEASLEAKFNAKLAMIESQIEGLRYGRESMRSTALPSEVSFGPSKRMRFSGGGHRASSQPRRRKAADPSRVWVVGFGRKLLKKDLDEVADNILNKLLPSEKVGKATVNSRDLREAVPIDFDDSDIALEPWSS